MIDESSGINLNVAVLPVTKKKSKPTNEVLEPVKPLKVVKPKLLKAEKTAQNEPTGILKKTVPVPTQSIWKKFKQAHKKKENDVKLEFVKPTVKPDRVIKKKVKVKDNEETVKNVKKKVSFENETSELNGSSPTFSDTPETNEVFKPKNKKFSNDKEEFKFLGDNNETNEPVFKKNKKSKFNKDSEKTALKKIFEPEQTRPEQNTGKTTSLFGNNPEIPQIPHRAVKPVKEAVFSNKSFEEMDLHPYMVKYLKESMKLTTMTTVQEKSIPVLLGNNDALIRSQTGSGKTLAFALPILHKLQEIRPKISRSDGVMVLVVVPTRELALQTYEVFNKLVKSYTWIVPGYLVGGEKRKSEKARLRKGISILIGTPGRLIDHVKHTKSLKLDKVSWLVIDEADRLLDMGYEQDVSILLDTLNQEESSLLKPSYLNPDEPKPIVKPQTRQTVLLSATLTQKVEKLAGLSLKNPVFVDACDNNLTPRGHVPVFSSDVGSEVDTMVLPESLVQKYVVTPPKLKLVTLASFILWKSKLTKEKKMLIFIATQDMVDYYTELLSAIFSTSGADDSDTEDTSTSDFKKSGVELFKLHGNMKQKERTEVFKTFRKSHFGVLLCTDVAARGLDLPEVDWVIQYTGPTSVSDYVHRVGRTARGGQSGSSIIFLTPNEVSFIAKLENCQIRLQEENMEVCLNHLLSVNPQGVSVQEEATKIQLMLENMVIQQSKLYDLACKAYSSWSRFYASYPRNMRDAFSVKAIHQGHYAKSFALRDPPSVIINYARTKNLNEGRFSKKRPREKSEYEKGKGFHKKSLMSSISEFDSGLEPLPKKKKL